MSSPTFVSDRLEFELRLIPGVLAVGSEGDRLVVITTSVLAAGEAKRFALARMGDETDVRVVVRPTEGVPEEALLQAIREVPGVNSCEIRRARSGEVQEVRVTVRSARAGDRAHAIVAAALGGRFAAERLLIALEITLFEDSSVPEGS